MKHFYNLKKPKFKPKFSTVDFLLRFSKSIDIVKHSKMSFWIYKN